MIKNISMLDLRKKPGQVLDETYYKKYRFVIKRNQKPMAVIVPIEDFERYFEDDDIRLYSKQEIKEFIKLDKLTPQQALKAKKLLSS